MNAGMNTNFLRDPNNVNKVVNEKSKEVKADVKSVKKEATSAVNIAIKKLKQEISTLEKSKSSDEKLNIKQNQVTRLKELKVKLNKEKGVANITKVTSDIIAGIEEMNSPQEIDSQVADVLKEKTQDLTFRINRITTNTTTINNIADLVIKELNPIVQQKLTLDNRVASDDAVEQISKKILSPKKSLFGFREDAINFKGAKKFATQTQYEAARSVWNKKCKEGDNSYYRSEFTKEPIPESIIFATMDIIEEINRKIKILEETTFRNGQLINVTQDNWKASLDALNKQKDEAYKAAFDQARATPPQALIKRPEEFIARVQVLRQKYDDARAENTPLPHWEDIRMKLWNLENRELGKYNNLENTETYVNDIIDNAEQLIHIDNVKREVIFNAKQDLPAFRGAIRRLEDKLTSALRNMSYPDQVQNFDREIGKFQANIDSIKDFVASKERLEELPRNTRAEKTFYKEMQRLHKQLSRDLIDVGDYGRIDLDIGEICQKVKNYVERLDLALPDLDTPQNIFRKDKREWEETSGKVDQEALDFVDTQIPEEIRSETLRKASLIDNKIRELKTQTFRDSEQIIAKGQEDWRPKLQTLLSEKSALFEAGKILNDITLRTKALREQYKKVTEVMPKEWPLLQDKLRFLENWLTIPHSLLETLQNHQQYIESIENEMLDIECVSEQLEELRHVFSEIRQHSPDHDILIKNLEAEVNERLEKMNLPDRIENFAAEMKRIETKFNALTLLDKLEKQLHALPDERTRMENYQEIDGIAKQLALSLQHEKVATEQMEELYELVKHLEKDVEKIVGST